MRESVIQKDIVDYLESLGCYVTKVIKANKNGVPDILFCHDGHFYAVEVKRRGNKGRATPLQRLHIRLIQNSGGRAIVADCVEDVQKLLGLYTDYDFLE